MDSSKSFFDRVADGVAKGVEWLNSNGDNTPQGGGAQTKVTNNDLMNMLCRLGNDLLGMKSKLEGQIGDSAKRMESIASQLMKLQGEVSRIDSQLDAIVSVLRELDSKMANAQSAASTVSETPTASEATDVYPIILYGGMLDGNGIGFASDMLSDNDQMQWVEVTVESPTTATYRIVPSQMIRGQMLENFDIYIEPAFDYGGEKPFSMSGIVDVEPGRLVLQGNLWKIVKKAKIKIV